MFSFHKNNTPNFSSDDDNFQLINKTSDHVDDLQFHDKSNTKSKIKSSKKQMVVFLSIFVFSLMSLAVLVAFNRQQYNYDSRKEAACNLSVSKWMPIEISFSGPELSETSTSPNNPFLDYRLNVKFISPTGKEINVPGFFDGDGSGSGVGNKWKVRFSPSEEGSWTYVADLRSGSNIAVDTNLSSGNSQSIVPDCQNSFSVGALNSSAPGFFKWGRLEYVGKHYPKFANGPYFIKIGTDSPENMLGFVGFDNTVDQGGLVPNFLHTFAPHAEDWQQGNPTFGSNPELSKNIIGALNYLSNSGINSIYFLPMNLGGDGQDTYPFVDANIANNKNYDVSKLNQWNIVLQHAQKKGIALNVVLSETEDQNTDWLGGISSLTIERKLYLRELIARFGYLPAIQWNIGEESKFPQSTTEAIADYLTALDWQNHQITYHTPKDGIGVYNWAYGNPKFDATSVQYTFLEGIKNSEFVEILRANSAQANRPWIVNMDENFGGLVHNPGHYRLSRLYDILFSGGGVEWYFGCTSPCEDVTAENFDTPELRELWAYNKVAHDFMQNNLPFWDMIPLDDVVGGELEHETYGGAEVFALPGQVYAIYFASSNTTGTIDLRNVSGQFTKQWFNPVNGQTVGPQEIVNAGAYVNNGTAPNPLADWILLYKKTDFTLPPPISTNTDPVCNQLCDASQTCEQGLECKPLSWVWQYLSTEEELFSGISIAGKEIKSFDVYYHNRDNEIRQNAIIDSTVYYRTNRDWIWRSIGSVDQVFAGAGSGEVTLFDVAYYREANQVIQHIIRSNRLYKRTSLDWNTWEDLGNINDIFPGSGPLEGFDTFQHPNGEIRQHVIRGNRAYRRTLPGNNWEDLGDYNEVFRGTGNGEIISFDVHSPSGNSEVIQQVLRGGLVWKRNSKEESRCRLPSQPATTNCLPIPNGGQTMNPQNNNNNAVASPATATPTPTVNAKPASPATATPTPTVNAKPASPATATPTPTPVISQDRMSL
ncbi:MAG: DUF5060 domain-containing protein [Pseudomonadales bacterium]|nr:DUF5060 domain-containing protein [Pseudomonadales bacterium]